jgi:hypothetical protein
MKEIIMLSPSPLGIPLPRNYPLSPDFPPHSNNISAPPPINYDCSLRRFTKRRRVKDV